MTFVTRSRAPHVLATEKFFELMIGGVKVIGRIDRTDQLPDGSIAIVDYKTGNPRDQEDADKSLQLSVYALATEQERNRFPARLAFYNLETNSTAETQRTPEELNEVKHKITQVAAAIGAGSLIRNPVCTAIHAGFAMPVQEEPLRMMEAAIPAKA